MELQEQLDALKKEISDLMVKAAEYTQVADATVAAGYQPPKDVYGAVNTPEDLDAVTQQQKDLISRSVQMNKDLRQQTLIAEQMLEDPQPRLTEDKRPVKQQVEEQKETIKQLKKLTDSERGTLDRLEGAFDSYTAGFFQGTGSTYMPKNNDEKVLNFLGELTSDVMFLFTPGTKAVSKLGIGERITERGIKKGLQKAITKGEPIKLAKRSLLKGKIVDDALTGFFVGAGKSALQGESTEEIFTSAVADSIAFPAIGIPLQKVGGAVKHAIVKRMKNKMAQRTVTGHPELDKLDEFIGLNPAPNNTEPLKARIKDKLNQAETLFVDEFAPLRQLSAKLFKETGHAIKPEMDPHKAATLYSGHYRKIENMIEKNIRPILTPVRDNLDDLRRVLTLEKLMEDAKNGIPTGQFSLKGLTEAKSHLQKTMGEVLYTKIDNAAMQLSASMDELLKLGKGTIISEQGYNTAVQKYQRYIPFKILEKNATEYLQKFGSSSISISKTPVKFKKGFKGTDYHIEDPLNAYIGKIHNTITAIEKSKVVEKFINLRNEYPQLKESFIPKSELSVKAVNALKNDKTMGVVSYLKDGKAQEYFVPKEFEDVLKRLNKPSFDFVSEWAQKSSAAMRAGATKYNIPFQYRNLVRDFDTQVYRSEYPVGPIGWLRGFYHAMKGEVVGDKFVDEMIQEGALTGGLGMIERNQRYLGDIIKLEGSKGLMKVTDKALKTITETPKERALKTITDPRKLMEFVSSVVEMAPRVGVYARSRQNWVTGKVRMTPLEAALEARNSTIDFAKGGLFTKVVNNFIPFLQARVGGTVNLGVGMKKHPMRSALYLAGKTGMAVTGLHWWNTRNFPEEYKSIPDDVFRGNHVIIYKNKESEKDSNFYALIPKSEPDKIFGNVLDAGLRFLDSKDPEALDNWFTKMLDDASPIEIFDDEGNFSAKRTFASTLLAPPAIRGAVEFGLGIDVRTGRPLEGKYFLPGLDKVAPELMYNDSTGVVAKELGKAIKTSPIRLQRLFGDIFGWAGQAVMAPDKLFDLTTRSFVGHRDNALGVKAIGILDKLEGKKQTDKRLLEIEGAFYVDQANKMTDQDRVNFLTKVGTEDPKLFEEIEKQMKDNRTLLDRVISNTTVKDGQRAKLIFDLIETSYTDEEDDLRQNFIKDLMQRTDENGKLLVTDQVFEDILVFMQMKRQQSKPKKTLKKTK